jgi:flagellar biosynthesis/type III secretory pathway protein FliH
MMTVSNASSICPIKNKLQSYEIKLEKLNEEEMKTYKTSEAYYKEIVRIYGSGHFKDGQEKGMRIGFRQGVQQGVQQGRLEGVREGMDKGRQEGMQLGVQQGRLEAALNALRRGRSAEEVSDLIGLPLEEVERLQKQFN